MEVILGSHLAMDDNLDALEKLYEELGVHTFREDSPTTDSVFLRDVFAWTPHGYIQCNMSKESRKGEPEAFFRGRNMFWAPMLKLTKDATFEGADLLWDGPERCLLGCGKRTNWPGWYQVKAWLSQWKVEVGCVELPKWHDQHLLGVCNIFNHRAYADYDFPYGIESLPHEEYCMKAANWVVVNKKHVVIGDCAHRTIDLLRRHGATVHPTPIDQLLKHGGGVACATGIISL